MALDPGIETYVTDLLEDTEIQKDSEIEKFRGASAVIHSMASGDEFGLAVDALIESLEAKPQQHLSLR